MKELHVKFSGQVQGIGFRYQAYHMASHLKLLGWVQNLNDGRVECLIQGEEIIIDQLIEQLNKHFAGYIQNVEKTWSKPTASFDDFQILL